MGFDGKTVTSMVLVVTGNGDTHALELRRDAHAGEPPMTTKDLDCLASGKRDSRCRRSSTRRGRSAPPPDPLGRAFLYSGRFWEKEQTLAFELVRSRRRVNWERGIPTFLTLQLSDGKLIVEETFGLGQHSHWELERVP